MSTINISQPHNLSIEEARAKLVGFEETMSKYGVSAKWDGAKATLKGMAVNGGIDVSGNTIDIVLKLGMMARAAGVDPTRLKASIEKRLQAAFSE
ncbi:MAG: putative polyhydroxyalkanoate system protein [Myxococcota bacterium]|jgi:putative polyhydroxyalkanoate system protein